jgi:hypothetical protein
MTAMTATGTASVGSNRPSDDRAGSVDRFDYQLYGLRVCTDLRLPFASIEVRDDAADVVVEQAPLGRMPPEPDGPLVASTPCNVHGVDMRAHRGPGGAWIWHRAIGLFYISPGERRVDIYPEADADQRVIGLLLAGQIAVFVLHQRGVPTLHASAVVTKHGAAAFLGPRGQGKSTMAASFLRRGATLLTDDVLPLSCRDGSVYGSPGLPLMKLWPEAAECTLSLTQQLPTMMAGYEKRLLALDGRPFAQFALAKHAVPVRGLYVLERYDPAVVGDTDVTIHRVPGPEGVAALLQHISAGAFLRPDEIGRFLPLYARAVAQASVCVLRYPSGFEYQEMVCERILDDLRRKME